MLDNALTPLSGRIWFVSAAVVAGRYVDLDEGTDADLFSLITDTLQLVDARAIIYDPRTTPSTIRYYEGGLQQEEVVSALSLNSDVSLDSIVEAINRIYNHCLVTPEAQAKAGKLWEKNTHWWAAS